MASPLFLKRFGEDGVSAYFHVDYLKSMLDYEINDALPHFSVEDLSKAIGFFANDETVKSYRPASLFIVSVNDVSVKDSNVEFNVSLNKQLTSSSEKFEWQSGFENYFDVWIEKFITVYSKYLMAASAGKLEEFTKFSK